MSATLTPYLLNDAFNFVLLASTLFPNLSVMFFTLIVIVLFSGLKCVMVFESNSNIALLLSMTFTLSSSEDTGLTPLLPSLNLITTFAFLSHAFATSLEIVTISLSSSTENSPVFSFLPFTNTDRSSSLLLLGSTFSPLSSLMLLMDILTPSFGASFLTNSFVKRLNTASFLISDCALISVFPDTTAWLLTEPLGRSTIRSPFM